LHNLTGHVPEGLYRVPLGKARIVKEGNDLTLVSLSHMTIESIKAVQLLSTYGIDAEIIDVRTLRPFDNATVLESVKKTGKLIVADTGWETAGFSAEILAQVFESGISLSAAPKRIALPATPSPSTPGLAKYYYPIAEDIVETARQMFGSTTSNSHIQERAQSNPFKFDIPDPTFTGPF
jgi:pyruvate dehydrogenase E1 component beta subunit